MEDGGDTYDTTQRMAEAGRIIRENQTGLVLTGRITNGRVELDQTTLDAIGQKFPDAEISFVAVNAPFDPQSQLV